MNSHYLMLLLALMPIAIIYSLMYIFISKYIIYNRIKKLRVGNILILADIEMVLLSPISSEFDILYSNQIRRFKSISQLLCTFDYNIKTKKETWIKVIEQFEYIKKMEK